jgi:hypothetical protein
MPTTYTDVTTTRSGVSGGTFPADEIAKITMGFNPRFEVRPEYILELAEKIASSPIGQREPVHIRKGKLGEPILMAGQCRRLAILHINENIADFMSRFPHIRGPLGLKYIDFAGMNETAAALHSVSENMDREPMSAIDKGKTILALQAMGIEDGEIATSLRCHKRELVKYLDFLTMPDEAQSALHGGEITEELARQIQDLPDAEIKVTIKKVTKGKVSNAAAVREVKNKKRAQGARIALTMKELLDQLTVLVDIPRPKENRTGYSLAEDLLYFITANKLNSYKSLKELVATYNLDPEEEEEIEAAEG